MEGTAQARLAIPLVVTDGPVATLGGLFGTVTPDTQLVSTALAVSGAQLQRIEENTRPRASLVWKPGQLVLQPAWPNQRWLTLVETEGGSLEVWLLAQEGSKHRENGT